MVNVSCLPVVRPFPWRPRVFSGISPQPRARDVGPLSRRAVTLVMRRQYRGDGTERGARGGALLRTGRLETPGGQGARSGPARRKMAP